VTCTTDRNWSYHSFSLSQTQLLKLNYISRISPGKLQSISVPLSPQLDWIS
jgi:hypothetical protein